MTVTQNLTLSLTLCLLYATSLVITQNNQC